MGLGLNQGGLSVAEWFCRHGARLTVTDLKTAVQLRASLSKLKKVPGAKKIKYTLGRHDYQDFCGQDVVIKNPGVPNSSPYLARAKKSGARIINEATLFFSVFPGPVIGVTGTRGKSTTCTLIHQLLKTKIKSHVLAGNIATQGMMAVADKLNTRSFPVLELSSWQLESLDEQHFSPPIAVITNVLEDHLNRYRNFSEYRSAKFALVKYQKSGDCAVLNFDNKNTREFSKKISSRFYFFSLEHKVRGTFVRQGQIYFFDKSKTELVMPVKRIKLIGAHNLSNILAAITVAKLMKISNKNISLVVSKFCGIKYRLEYLGKKRNVAVYNDATSTTPDAALAALQALADKSVVLIAGGMDKKLDYRALARQIKKQVKFLVLLDGTGSIKLQRELRRLSFPAGNLRVAVKTLRNAWQLAWTEAVKNQSIILFSPAATSFNMFINEFDRARQFEKLYYGQKAS